MHYSPYNNTWNTYIQNTKQHLRLKIAAIFAKAIAIKMRLNLRHTTHTFFSVFHFLRNVHYHIRGGDGDADDDDDNESRTLTAFSYTVHKLRQNGLGFMKHLSSFRIDRTARQRDRELEREWERGRESGKKESSQHRRTKKGYIPEKPVNSSKNNTKWINSNVFVLFEVE